MGQKVSFLVILGVVCFSVWFFFFIKHGFSKAAYLHKTILTDAAATAIFSALPDTDLLFAPVWNVLFVAVVFVVILNTIGIFVRICLEDKKSIGV